jgi:hypothetical protein
VSRPCGGKSAYEKQSVFIPFCAQKGRQRKTYQKSYGVIENHCLSVTILTENNGTSDAQGHAASQMLAHAKTYNPIH